MITLRGLFELVHVVADIEGASAERADGLGSVGRDVVVTSRAFERSNGSHILDVTGFVDLGGGKPPVFIPELN